MHNEIMDGNEETWLIAYRSNHLWGEGGVESIHLVWSQCNALTFPKLTTFEFHKPPKWDLFEFSFATFRASLLSITRSAPNSIIGTVSNQLITYSIDFSLIYDSNKRIWCIYNLFWEFDAFITFSNLFPNLFWCIYK